MQRTLGKGVSVMNRDEVLARSQKENHGQDIVNLEIAKDSLKNGWIVIVCLLAVVSVVDALVFDRMNSEVFFAITAATSVVFFLKYYKLHQKHELFIAIIDAVAAAAFFVAWILELVKY